MPMTAPQSSITAQAADAEYKEVQDETGQVTYRVYADHAEACRLADFNSALPVTVLSAVEGVPVTAIAANAFQNKGYELQEITVPDSVTVIGEHAFEGTNIRSLMIPDSVTSIEPYAFSYCSELSELRLPKNLEKISNSSFMCCHRLRSVTIPDSVTVIEQYAFAGSPNLEDILIPDSVQSLRYNSFIGTKWIQNREDSDAFVTVNGILIRGTADAEGKLTLPDGVTKIAEETFLNNETVTKVTVPESVSVIADEAFTKCKNLKDITILNPQCTIVSSEPGMTICNSAEPFDGTDGEVHWKPGFYGTIHGYAGSTAESYAKENGYSFKPLGTAKGDVNGDGSVDLKDVTYMRRALVGWEDTIIEAAADVNRDGSVDLKDLVILRRYLAGGWNIEL